MQNRLLPSRQLAGDRASQPVVAPATIVRERQLALAGQLKERTTPIQRIGTTLDEALLVQLGDGLRHRLWAHALKLCQLAGAPWAFSVEASEHSAVGKREAVLCAQAAYEATDYAAQLAGY